MAAAGVFLYHGSFTSSSVAHDCPLITAGLGTLHCSRTISSVHQVTSVCSRNLNASAPSTNSRLEESQILGEEHRGSSRFSLLLPQRSRAVYSAGLTVPDRQFKALYRTRSSHCLVRAIAGQAFPSRSGLSLLQKRPRSPRGQIRPRKPECVGTSSAGVMTLKPFLDQILLLGTVFGVYIAGVASFPRLPQLFRDRGASSPCVPVVKREPFQQQKPSPQSRENAGEDGWSLLQFKLSQAMLRETNEVEEEQAVTSPMLGLQAVARVPRLSLFLTTLQYLRKEVEAISDAEQYIDLNQWQEVALNVLSGSIAPICKDWLSQELWQTKQPTDVADRVFTYSGIAKPLIHEGSVFKDMATNTGIDTQGGDTEFSNSMEANALDSMMDILKESETIPSYLKRSGKAGLYADLIFFLRFGSARLRGCCDHRVFKKHTANVLEDMVVAIAEVVATLFLDSISLASLSPHGELWQTFLLPSILSSRSLERFRNEVALYGWLNQNFTSVAAMFEDRFDLWTMQRRPNLSKGKKQGKSLKKKPVKGEMSMKSDDLVLTHSQLPARRSTELKALTGWRYYYSLFLELSDVVGPLLSILLSKLGDALSFLLITLIGRSLGLVYQGIRQSLRWPSIRKDGSTQ